MTSRCALAGLTALAVTLVPLALEAQSVPFPIVRRQLNDFFEFRGRWTLDEKESIGIPRPPEGLPPEAVRLFPALEIARDLVIATSETEFSVAKDGAAPEVYKVDGSEMQERDPRTGVGLDRFY